MSIFDIFKQDATPAPAPTVPAATTTPAAPPTVAIPEPKVVADPNNPTVPAQAAPVDDITPKTPLDEFSGLWDTVKVKEGDEAPKPPAPLTQEELQKAVAKADFSSAVSPEMLTQIAAGGEEAQTAFSQAMNAVAQKVMVQSTLVNNKLTEQTVSRLRKEYETELPELLRQHATTNHMKDANPLFSSPAIKPVIAATQAQLQTKFPEATAAQITEMTENYIKAMGEAFAPKPAAASNTTGGQDWSKFLEN